MKYPYRNLFLRRVHDGQRHKDNVVVDDIVIVFFNDLLRCLNKLYRMSEKPSQNKELRAVRFYFFDAGRFPEIQSAKIDLYLIVIDSSVVIHGKVRNTA